MRCVKGILNVAAITMLLTGCWGGDVKPDMPGTRAELEGAAPRTQITLKMMWWGSPARYDATVRAMNEYEKLHPEIRLVPETTEFSAFENRLAALQAAGNMPDIIQLDASWLTDWVEAKRLAVLDKDTGAAADPELRQDGMLDGKLYAVPLGVTAFGFLYNKQAFQELGIPLPNETWTWDEFKTLLEQSKNKLRPGQYFFQDMTVLPSMYDAYQLSKGLDWPNSGGQFHYDRATWLEWVNLTAQWRKDGISAPPELTLADRSFDESLDLLLTGKVLMKALYSSEMPAYEKMKPGAMAVAPIPSGIRGGGWIKSSMHWGIRADSPHLKEAQAFVDWFVSDGHAAEVLGTTRGVPVSAAVREHLDPKWTPADRLAFDIIKLTKPQASPYEAIPGLRGGWVKFDRDYKALLRELMFDKLPPEQAWSKVEAMGRELR